MKLITVSQIAYREKKGSPRMVIPAGTRFDTSDIKGVSLDEWNSMLGGSNPAVRVPDDPAFAAPQPQPPAEVAEGSSPRVDLASQAAARAAAEDDGDDDSDADEDDKTAARKPRNGRRKPGRRARPADDDDDV